MIKLRRCKKYIEKVYFAIPFKIEIKIDLVVPQAKRSIYSIRLLKSYRWNDVSNPFSFVFNQSFWCFYRSSQTVILVRAQISRRQTDELPFVLFLFIRFNCWLFLSSFILSKGVKKTLMFMRRCYHRLKLISQSLDVDRIS